VAGQRARLEREAMLGRLSVLSAALWAAAAAYFSLGAHLTLEWSDEGHMIYSSWRTAEGALPYRDFPHLYGPSLFFLNGALLHWFGADLAVVRCSLVVWKASLAVLVFLAARRVAPPALALAAYAVLVAVFGTPWWIFSTPYAQHYASVLNLAGLLLVLVLRRPALGGAAAGLCFGLATTFKQTTGAFAAIGLAWFLLYRREEGAPAGAAAPALARAVRIAALVAALLVLGAYASKAPHAWSLLVLLGPATATTVLLVRREVAHPPSPNEARQAASGVLACGLGMAVPVAAYAFFYLAAGGLERLADDLFGALPWKIHWFAPFPAPRPAAAGSLALAGALLAAGWAGARRRGGAATRTPLIAAAALFVAGAGLLVAARLGNPWLNPTGVVVASLYWLPPLSVAAATPLLFAAPPRLDGERRDALALFHFHAVVSLLYLSPNADVMHLLTALPIFLVLAAYLLGRTIDSAAPPARGSSARAPIAIAAALLLAVAASPFVRALLLARGGAASHQAPLGFARASGIHDGSPKMRQAAELVEFLRDGPGRERPLLVIANEQMLYFLAAKRSPLERFEFFFFLIGGGVISAADARASVDQAWAIERLRQARPLIVDVPGGQASRRFHAALPALGAFITESYAPLQRFGEYAVLQPAATE
jgi:hypothetical protein